MSHRMVTSVAKPLVYVSHTPYFYLSYTCTLKYVGDLICGASIFCVLGSSEAERCLSFTARPTREKFVKAIIKSKLLQTYDFSCFFHCSNFLHIINMLLIYQAFSLEQVFWRVLSVWKLEVMSLPVLSDNLTRTRRNYSVAELWFTVGLKFIALILSVPCLLLLVLSNRCANKMKHWQIF